MNKKEISVLESYFKTKNEHWNVNAFELLCEVLQYGNFENPEIPLLLFSKSIDIFREQYESPLMAVQAFGIETDKHDLNPNQKLFIYDWILKYLKYSEFDDADIHEIKQLLKSQTEHLKYEIKNQESEKNRPVVGNIRDILKKLLRKELDQLPETLKELEPVQRLNILCKLIPYVLPKVEAIHSEKGESEWESKKSISGFNWEM